MDPLATFAAFAHRRPGRLLALSGVAVALAAAGGGNVAKVLGDSAGGRSFEATASENVHARGALARATGVDPEPGVVVVVRTPRGVSSPAGRAEVASVRRTLAADAGIGRVSDPARATPPALAADGRAAYVLAWLRAGDDAAQARTAERVQADFAGRPGVEVGGAAVATRQVGDQVQADLSRAEMLALPLLFLLALWVFRGVVAALLPIVVGVIAIVGGLLVLRVAASILPVSVFALNLVTGLGLGLGIDYSLFMVSRYREELARHGPGQDALVATVRTAGRTVLFSAMTVAAALASLLLFPLPFLYSMGLGGVAVALIAAGAALVPLVALLALLGPRVNALSPARWRRAAERTARPLESGGWYRLARAVTRRPAPVAIAATAVLLLAALPALRIVFTGVDSSALPVTKSARQVDDVLRAQFPRARTSPIFVAVRAPAGARPALTAYAQRLERIPGVAAVSAPRALGPVWELDVFTGSAPLSPASRHVLAAVRRTPVAWTALAGGETAHFVDQQASLRARLPLAIGLLVATTLVLLFAMTRSVVLPVKALLMNVLTISASLGLLVLIFQDGRLESLLGYHSQGALEATQPILLCALAFGLSTDYGVFLLTRIKETHDAGASDADAVAAGLERTGRIVSAAAVLFTVAIGAFATSQIAFIKEVGVGTALAVLIDATIVRSLLVPALMALLGARNWWAPRFLTVRPAVRPRAAVAAPEDRDRTVA